ncbi:hypothetical protein, partial [Microcoleus sp. PH2017_28_MFU_U_A]|uniref:hypothetical protein n=1 Tax=Microcoleus sp. PH2017_28_MFU_U_A TaxID=2798838 RepID=UPI001DB88510
AMREWGITLRIAYFSPNSRKYHRKIPPPAVLVPILPLIASLVNLDRRTEIKDALKRVAPPPPYEQIPEEYMEHCYEATMLSGVIDRALTLKALQTIASRLNDTERKELCIEMVSQRICVEISICKLNFPALMFHHYLIFLL